jgi:ADP-ribose pyrophosphatase YjhB (NUDIX family)
LGKGGSVVTDNDLPGRTPADDAVNGEPPGPSEPARWLAWAREIQRLGQNIQTFARNEYDTENGRRLLEIAAEIVAERTGERAAELVGDFLRQPGYATPKVDVRAAVVRDGAILLVQEAFDRRWCLPGGWADVGSVPGTEAARECEEESGFRVRPDKVVGVFDANRGGRPMEFFHAYKVVFLCEIIGGEARTSHETLAIDFFPLDALDELPPLSQNRTNLRHLEEVRAHVADPNRATWFD